MAKRDSLFYRQLIDHYQQLSEVGQETIAINCLCYEFLQQSDFINIVKSLLINNQSSSKLKDLKGVVSDLVELQLLDQQFQCHDQLRHYVIKEIFSKPIASQVIVTLVDQFRKNSLTEQKDTDDLELNNKRAVLIAIYSNEASLFNDHSISVALWWKVLLFLDELITMIPIDIDWLKERQTMLRDIICLAKLTIYYYPTQNNKIISDDFSQWFDYYQQFSLSFSRPFFQYLVWQIDIGMGLLDKVKEEVDNLEDRDPYALATSACLDFFARRYEQAQVTYENALSSLRQQFNNPIWLFDDIHGLLYLLLLIANKKYTKAGRYARVVMARSLRADLGFQLIYTLVLAEQNNYNQAWENLDSLFSVLDFSPLMPMTRPLFHIIARWIAADAKYHIASDLAIKAFKKYHPYCSLVAYLYAGLLPRGQNKAIDNYFCGSPFSACNFHQFISLHKKWQYQLQCLSRLITEEKQTTDIACPSSNKRLVWLIHPQSLHIEASLQQKNRLGHWGKGRTVALNRLYMRDTKLDYLTAKDWAVVDGLREEYQWRRYDHRPYYKWQQQIAFKALIGHPLVFHLDKPDMSIELIEGHIELHIKSSDQGYQLRLSVTADSPKVILKKVGQHSYVVIIFSKREVEISQIISAQGLSLPLDAKDNLLNLLRFSNANIKICSDLEDDGYELTTVIANSSCWLQLFPVDNSLKISFWVRPFGDKGPYYRPATGASKVIFEGKQKTLRDLGQERQVYQTVIADCFDGYQVVDGDCFCRSSTDCLEILSRLERYRETHPIHIEWPRGKNYFLHKPLSHHNITCRINSHQKWFEYDGDVTIDDGKVLSLKALLALLSSDKSVGRFIEIAPGDFVELNKQLKQQLQKLQKISESGQVGWFASSILDEFSSQVSELDCDDGWRKHLKEIVARKNYQPRVPKNLTAELRDYQLKGFQYLSRLANWQIGACLADDMGLGKTLQTIAVLLKQAKKGPILVIAPTSVCFNWGEEFNKFAKDLKVHMFVSPNRKQVVEKLVAMDVLICSYSLLLSVIDLLTLKKWQVVVLDEAQAIKNPNTKRFRAVMKLQSVCRFALTGTPIENNLIDLWSIFHFIVPGLLGSIKQFQKKYINPMSKEQDVLAKQVLKDLVRPYILRRLKSDVLKELPPKTEQTIKIEPTPEEMNFYETIRQNALEAIDEAEGLQSNKKRFVILSQITKLRQASCSASLLQPKLAIPQSKVNTLLSIIETLKVNNHKALVFSQFVRYLNLIKPYLDKANISYQYIDGAMSNSKRKKAVHDFQSGTKDIFLLSLKAGGVGLNLTEADYVILLDPWWNPAVEDQASDRTHRIGQKRSVTVYRLITSHTIEEKIVKMHQEKRRLAKDLLGGSEAVANLTEQQLIALIN